jgi:hypothetical protein
MPAALASIWPGGFWPIIRRIVVFTPSGAGWWVSLLQCVLNPRFEVFAIGFVERMAAPE